MCVLAGLQDPAPGDRWHAGGGFVQRALCTASLQSLKRPAKRGRHHGVMQCKKNPRPWRAGLLPGGGLALALLLGGCAQLVGPYERPAAALPRGLAADEPAADLDRLPWRQVYTEPRLQQLIALSLAQNRDLRVAALNVERARALYQVQDAGTQPNLALGASATRADTGSRYSASLGLAAYELDFFGRVRQLNESALQSFLQSEAARQSARLSLVAETANAWLGLAADQARLVLAERTLASREQSLTLTQRRYELGAIGGLPLAQARTARDSARADLASAQAQIALDRHALELLLGTALPEALLPRAEDLGPASAPLLPVLPAAVPSSVLQRRPDVLAAEHALQAAHADVGVARAARFPRISLTGSLGSASSELSALFDRGSWSFGPSLSLPLLDGGAATAQARAAEQARAIALAQYDKALQQAFREVADGLSQAQSLDERLQAQQALYASARRQLELAEASYRAGATGQLELLDAQRSLDAAAQGLITLQQSLQSNRIGLYKALGGGWQTESQEAAAAAWLAPQTTP